MSRLVTDEADDRAPHRATDRGPERLDSAGIVAGMSVALTAPRERANPASVWSPPDFRIMAVGQGISALGDAVSFTALPLLVLALTGSGAAMGIVAALQTLPDLLLGLPAGALADRWDRRRMMPGLTVDQVGSDGRGAARISSGPSTDQPGPGR